MLEREVEGEKLVTRYILEQTRRNGDDLAAIITRLGRVETRLGSVEGKVDVLSATVNDLKTELPGIVRDAMRDRTRKRERKS